MLHFIPTPVGAGVFMFGKIIAILFQVAPGFPFKRLPYRIFRAMRIKELLQVAIQRAHFARRIHGVVGRADLPEARSAHELEKAQTGLAICRALKVRILLRQDRMSGVSNGAIAFDVGVEHPAQVRRVALELFQIAIRFIACKGRGKHERRMAEQVILHVRFIGHPVFCALEDLPDQPLV